MEMINRAIEGASDYAEFQRKLLDGAKSPHDQTERRLATVDDRRTGENRQQRRARIRSERKAAKRSPRTTA